MSYGALIQNASGDTLIDGELSNYLEKQRGTIATNGSVHRDYVSIGSDARYPYGIWAPPLCVASPQDRHLAWLSAEANAISVPEFPHTAYYSRFWFTQDTGGSVAIPYRLYHQAPLAASGYGLQVFAADGAVIYDSQLNVFKIIDVVSITNTLTSSTSSTQTITHTSKSDAFYLLNPLIGNLFTNYVSSYWDVYVRGIKQASATTAQLAWVDAETTKYDAGGTLGGVHVPDTQLIVCEAL